MRRWALAFLVVTSALGGLAAPAHAMTREQADALAKKILRPSGYANAVLYGLPLPIGRGSEVSDDAPGPSGTQDDLTRRSRPFKVTREAWFFWEDIDHGADFEHPSRLLILDAATGGVVASRKLYWRPLINGKLPRFLASPGADTDPGYVVYSSQPLSPEEHPVAPTGNSILPGGYMRDDCLVTVGDRSISDSFRGDFQDFAQWAAHVAMRSFPMPANSDGAALVQRVHELTTTADSPCHNIVIVLAGHGSPGPDFASVDPNAAISRVPAVRSGYDFGVDPKDKTLVDIRTSRVTGPDIQKLLAENPLTTFELVVDSCFSGRFEILMDWQRRHKLANLRVVATSSGDDEPTVGYIGRGVPDSPGHSQQPNDLWAGLRDLLLNTTSIANPNPPRQTPAESDYVRTFVDSLYRWSDNKSVFLDENGTPTGGFVAAVLRAGVDAEDNYVAKTLHWTHPQVLDSGTTGFDYHYDVKVVVSGAKATWTHGNNGGAAASSWELDVKDADFFVDPASRAAVMTAGAQTFTVKTTGTWTTTSPPAATCSYNLDRAYTSPLDFALSAFGDDFSSPGKPFVSNGFQNTDLLAINIVDGGFPFEPDNGIQGCDPRYATDYTMGLIFLGTTDCASGRWLFTIPAWDLGKQTITATAPFRADARFCLFGYPQPNDAAALSGSYQVTFTRKP